jgi:hypothetical protein
MPPVGERQHIFSARDHQGRDHGHTTERAMEALSPRLWHRLS